MFKLNYPVVSEMSLITKLMDNPFINSVIGGWVNKKLKYAKGFKIEDN